MNTHIYINQHWLKRDDSPSASEYKGPVWQPCIISTNKRKFVYGRKGSRHTKTYIQEILRQVSTIHRVQAARRRRHRRKEGGDFLKNRFTCSYIRVKPELTCKFFLKKVIFDFQSVFYCNSLQQNIFGVVKTLKSSRTTLCSWLILSHHHTAQ